MNYLVYTKTLILGLVLQMFLVHSMMASSHREAPLISSDPLADNADLYAFRSPDNPNMITIIATYVPLQLPHGGPNYYTFGENVRYEIHVDNDVSNPGDEIIYRFTFKVVNEDPTTFFNIRLGKQNQKTTYLLERSTDGGQSFQKIVTNGYVPPYNIGPRSIESPVGLNTSYASLFQKGITSSHTGETVFAGPVDDPFFVDLGGIFDLGDAPRQMGRPVDGLACYNVSAIAIQIPISTLLKKGAPSTPATILDPNYVIGVWASASRPSMTTLSSTADPAFSGDWVQVSRLGMPLTNEAVIAIGDKDYWNSLSPYEEITDTILDEYFYNPELALYMDDDQFGGAVPAFADLRIQTNSLGAFDFTNGANGLYGLKGNPALEGTALDDDVFGTLLLPGPGKPRSVDLWPAFHTGVPNVIPYQLATGKGGNPLAAGKPFVNNFLPNGGDMLRLNMAVPVTQRDDPFFSSLGLIQAAAIGLTVAPYNDSSNLEFIPNMDGFPNGRRLEDDVTRIELQAVGGIVLAAVGLWYDDYDPNSSPSPVTQDLLNVLSYTTGVESNDRPFTSEFPYLAMPFSGTGECGGEIFRGDPAEEDVLASKYFASSNTQNKIAILDVFDDKVIEDSAWTSRADDADGIFYDKENDVLYQLNRTENVIDVYANVAANMQMGMAPEYVVSSSSDFINGRGISVSDGVLVVAQDANDANNQTNKFVIYNVSSASIEFDRALTIDKPLWGVELVGNTLYAIEDMSWNLLIFKNLSRKDGHVSPDRTIIIEDMVRTHGLSYDSETDVMVLTDIGSGGSATDGAIVVVSKWKEAIRNRYLTADEQARIEGPNSSLGNPVDVAYDGELNVVFVAERASEGGKILAFQMPKTSGDASPFYSLNFAGASSIAGSDIEPIEEVDTTTMDSTSLAMVTNLPGSHQPIVNVIYPNPTANEINVVFSEYVNFDEDQAVEMKIISMTGAVVATKSASSSKMRWDVSSLNAGVYFIHIKTSTGTQQLKFFKL